MTDIPTGWNGKQTFHTIIPAMMLRDGKLRDELLNAESFYTLKEAKVLIERWRTYYNTIGPHNSLG